MSNNTDLAQNINSKSASDFKKAINDIFYSFLHWRIFCMLGSNDIRKRYARSKIGQLWLTLSLAINTCTISLVWSYLFNISLSDYLPFLTTGTILWTYMSLCIQEGSVTYINFAPYLQTLDTPKLTYVNSLLFKNIIIIGHNLVILVTIFILFSLQMSFIGILQSLVGLVLTTIFLYPIVTILALLSVRFRDCPNIIISLMQIVYYVTPIMWKTDQMPARFQELLILNPFAVFLTIWRNPMLNLEVASRYWLAAYIYIMLAWIIGFTLFKKYRARIVYWL